MPDWLQDTIVAIYFIASIVLFVAISGEVLDGYTSLWLMLGWMAWGGAMKLADWY